MVWESVFCRKVKIPAKIVRYKERERNWVIDIRLIAPSYHSPMIYLLWMYSHFMAPKLCHWIFKMNGWLASLSVSFFLSPFWFSHQLLCWSHFYLEMFSETLPLVYFTVNSFLVLQAPCCFSFHLLSGKGSYCSHVDSGQSIKMDTSISGAGWWVWQNTLMCLKVTNESRGLYKVSMARGKPSWNVLNPHAVCSARGPVWLSTGVWGWRWHVCTGGEPSTSCLCK